MTGELNHSRERLEKQKIKNVMAKIFIILIITLCTGCFGKQHSSKHNNVSNINESDIQLDSLPLTKYEYKMRGNLKDDIGDKLGAIEDYARAIKIDTSYDTAYYNRGLMKSAIGDREGELADYNKISFHYTKRRKKKQWISRNFSNIFSLRATVKTGQHPVFLPYCAPFSVPSGQDTLLCHSRAFSHPLSGSHASGKI